ncbi:MAG: diadenylate cyclase [Bacilli bacterium]|nr:diadenylate cyclase [Bacilli bacterium]
MPEFSWLVLIDSIVYLIAVIVIYLIIKKVFVRSNIAIPLFVATIINIVASYFSMSLISHLCIAATVCLFLAVVISNDQKMNKLMKRKKATKENGYTSEDRRQLYKVINNTVAALSTSKTGAIMTFEKHNSLDEFINKGVKINAPVCQELLTTIFYNGTTLHDGAVIIRGNTIIAASVYYIPTVKPMNGKYGARHRASLGISEVCDAVTVVVSEETGRISLAIDGELQAVSRENFLQSFKREMEK